MSLGLNKSIALNEIGIYSKSRMRTEGDEIEEMEKSLFHHQDDFLKIKRLKHNVNGKLYHTENPKVIESQDLPSFRRYKESEELI
jgi:hypothetical protein